MLSNKKSFQNKQLHCVSIRFTIFFLILIIEFEVNLI